MERWDYRFFGLARHVAGWSYDPFVPVGAVVVDGDDKRKIAFGFSGLPPQIADEFRPQDRRVASFVLAHAEIAALRNAQFELEGAILFSTKFPCLACAREIVEARVERIVAPEPDWASERSGGSARAARSLFEKAGIAVTYVDKATLDGMAERETSAPAGQRARVS
jgi:dCMP deaminase